MAEAADHNPELQAKLDELERELEEGDITTKGYQKRRTQLLSQYLGSSTLFSTEDSSGPLGIHSPEHNSQFGSDGHRAATLAALSASSPDNGTRSPTSVPSPKTGRPQSPLAGATDQPHPASLLAPGGSFADQRPIIRPRDSLFLAPVPNQGSTTEPSRTGTMLSTDYAFNPEYQPGYGDAQHRHYESQSRSGTLLDSQGYFLDFAGQQSYEQPNPGEYGGPHRYSTGDAFSPTAAMAPPMLTANDLPPPAALEYQMPLEPREVPFAIQDPHDPNTPMSKFDNIAAVLRHRGRTMAKLPAYWVLDNRGKEIASITWEKLASRAEKVAQVIRDKSSLYRGDRVALIYRDTEIIEFAIALLGCFIAGVVAVPINEFQDHQKLNLILTSTQAHLALTTENNLKAFQREITTQKLTWPKGVEWWKTNEFGSYHPKRKDDIPPLSLPDLAYIEFSRSPTGDFRGVVLSHRTIMHQMACLSAIVSTVPGNGPADTFNTSLRDKNGRLIGGGASSEILLSYLDPRQGIGMILGVLLTVYGGHTMVWLENKAVDVPGLYAHLITKYKATLMVADYPGLRRAVYNYQQDPMTTRNYKKGMEPNFQTVKLCLIDTLTVDGEFHELLADRWLRPLRNTRAREVVAPMLCLPEHGGMVISVRDWLGGEERMGCPLKLDMGDESDRDSEDERDKEKEDKSAQPNGFGSLLGGGTTSTTEQRAKNELSEVLLDREALKSNDVVIVAIGEEARKKAGSDPNTVRVGAFGYPIPDATLAVVEPDTGLLASPHAIGEIWVDSPSLSGGFWALPKHTEQIFHARPYKFEPGDPTPTMIEPEFLRTGLLGTVIEGKIFVLGLYEDRIRQKVEWVEHGNEIAVEHRYFFVQHIIFSIMRNVPKIYACSAFDVFVNEEHLPVVVLESVAASTAPATAGGPPRQLDKALLDSLAERCMDVLLQEHHLRVYCVLTTAPNSLPRVVKNGRRDIGNMLCRRDFDSGQLPSAHVKFGVEHAVLNLPIGVDPIGGIWSHIASMARQDLLMHNDKQYSGIDRREVVIDDRTSTPLNNFSCITDLIQWRVARQGDELAYCTVDGRGKEGKGITWRKFDTKVASVAMYLKNKVKIRAGDHVVLMYTHSEDFVFSVHACINLGAIVIPIPPMDQNRLPEDVPAFLHLVNDYGVKAVLVNQDVDHLLKMKPVSQHIKQSAQVLRVTVPSIYNTSRPPKQNNGLRELGVTMDPTWVQPGYPVIIWTYWTPDQRRLAVQLGHDTVMGMCKVQKETCQMTSSRPVLGCVRSTTGLGFIHTCLMGIYIGTPTYLLSPVEFAQNPISLFHILSRYKIKDTYATPQMLDHAIATMPAKGFALHELKNMMISSDGRPRADVFQKVRLHFAAVSLDRTAINTVYSHVLNPMIASRSYMCIEPIELWLDTRALRRGLIVPTDPEADPRALLVQDSGMVPVSTQIAIVNPESRLLCNDGEYGEIWVDSEACVKCFYGSKDAFDAERFDGRTLDGDPNIRYVRTGDLGFLYNVSRPIGPGGAQVDMQVLFVLGNIGETFEINGLSHFPMDIENTVERCHRSIVPQGCAVFQAGGLVVVLVEVARKSFLTSLVPVIVNSILNEHQIVVDIVAFVARGAFPRSRLGEKQRGKILAGWVSRKMATIAQWAIRDTDTAGLQDAIPMENSAAVAAASAELNRASIGSHRSFNGGTALPGRPSSLRNAESVPQILEQREPEQRMSSARGSIGASVPAHGLISEMPADLTVADGSNPNTMDKHGSTTVGQSSDMTPPTKEKLVNEVAGPQVREQISGNEPGSFGNMSQTKFPGEDGRESLFDNEDDWRNDAIMHMNLANNLQQRDG